MTSPSPDVDDDEKSVYDGETGTMVMMIRCWLLVMTMAMMIVKAAMVNLRHDSAD